MSFWDPYERWEAQFDGHVTFDPPIATTRMGTTRSTVKAQARVVVV